MIHLNNTPNNCGKINKGAGLIEAWQDNVELLKKYDYIIHYEPRQQMIKDLVISAFNKEPGNYIKKRSARGGMETGFFIIESKYLIDYVNNKNMTNLVSMCKNNISIENNFRGYINSKKLQLKEIPHLGIIWYEARRNNAPRLL